MKKTILYSSVVVLLLTVIIAGFFYIHNQKKYDSNALMAIPINVECVFKFNSIKDLHTSLESKSGMYKEIKNSGILNDFYQVYSLVDSIMEARDIDFEIDKSITCATKLVGKTSVDILYVLELDNLKELKSLKNLVSECLSAYSIKKKSYSGEEVFFYTKGVNRYVISYVKGLFIMSKSVICVENAIRQINSENNLLSLPSFNKVQKTVDENSDLVLFVNNGNISKLVKLWSASKYFSFINKIDNWGSWTGLDIDFDDEGIFLNGFSSSSNNKFELFDVLSHQESVETSLLDDIPSGTATFAILSLSDVRKYREDMIKYRGKLGRLNRHRRQIIELNKKFSCKFEDKFYSFFSGEAAQLSLSVNSIAVNGNKISIFKSIGQEKLKSEMLGMLKTLAENEKKSLSYYTKTVKIDRELSYKLYKMPFKDIPYRIMGDLFYEAPSNYFVIVGNNLVFGSSVKVLSDYLHAYSLKKSILDDSSYSETNNRFSDKSNYIFYANTYFSLPLLKSYFNPVQQRSIKNNKDCLTKFNSVGYQLASANSMVYNNLFALYSEDKEQRPQTEWESGLEADAIMKPAIVKNHKTGETEIIIQDANNNVYLINSLGRILWKQPIEGRINSDIHQIDVYRNKKLQYLFSTKSRVYLIDRNGNNVGKYPIKLKSPTTQGLSVFDYDNTRKYRIFVPSVNRKIYVYDANGRIVKGWAFKTAENEITSKVHHYRVKTKDYIVFKDKFKVYILSRRGQSRAKSKYHKLSNNDIVFVDGKSPHLLVTDINASVYNIGFTGSVKKLSSYKKISAKHLFTAADIDNDGKQDYIFVDGKRMLVYSSEDKIIDVEFKGVINEKPSIYTFSRMKKMIGIVESNNNKVHLIDKKGNNYSGFPVSGDKPFSITFMSGKIAGFYMFVGSGDKSLYKYRVQR